MFRLFGITVIGLGLNSAMVWLRAEILGVDPTLAKILAVFPVFAWNYLGRRMIVFNGTPSADVALLTQSIRGKP
jgi:hypothetical protein